MRSANPFSANSKRLSEGQYALVLLCCAFLITSAAQASWCDHAIDPHAPVEVFLHTDYQPSEVASIYISLADHATNEVREWHLPVTDPWGTLIQIPDFPCDDFSASIQFIASDFWVMASDSSNQVTIINGFAHLTFSASQPEGTATKSGFLLEDRDGDGGVSNGDVVQYIIEVDGELRRFVDHLSDDLVLVPGSVTTTDGEIASGNLEGDHVEIDGPTCCTTTITYEAIVQATVSNQGLAILQGENGNYARLPTDDPDTPEVGDATLLPASSGELALCQEALQEVTEAWTAVADELEAVLADPDNDGVPAIMDLCPAADATSRWIDDRGCSQSQFCSAITVPAKGSTRICDAADWRQDEAGLTANDCQTTNDRRCIAADP